MSPVNPLENPVVNMSPEMAGSYTEQASQLVYEQEASVPATAEAPSQFAERLKYMAIGAATLTFIVSPFVIYGAQQYRQMANEHSQIPKNRIVVL